MSGGTQPDAQSMARAFNLSPALSFLDVGELAQGSHRARPNRQTCLPFFFFFLSFFFLGHCSVVVRPAAGLNTFFLDHLYLAGLGQVNRGRLLLVP